jgi:hypothetical protein
MSFWGLPWGVGFPWGIEAPDVDETCALADDRVLVQMDDTTGNRKFRDFICNLVGPLGEYITVMRAIVEAFDIENADGEQLDFIGNVIGLKRQGFNDIRYRTFLLIQRDLILAATREDANWTGTHNNILAICRTFIGIGGGSISLVNFGMYSFALTIPSITDPVEFNTLIGFL